MSCGIVKPRPKISPPIKTQSLDCAQTSSSIGISSEGPGFSGSELTTKTVESSIKFISERWKGRLNGYSKTKESITKFLVKNNNASTQRNDEVYNKLSSEEKGKLEKIVQDAIDVFNQTPK